MRYNEFQLNEDELRQIARQRYPHLTEEQLDEILPAIGAIAGRVAAGAGKLAAKGAMAVGKMAAKGAVAGAKAAGRVGAQMGKAVAKGAANAAKSAGQQMLQKGAQKLQQKANDKMAQQMLKPGTKLPVPDAQGKEQEFEIDTVQGQEITLKNPKPKPGKPIKTIHNKKDLDPIIQQLAGTGA